ncbi:MAG: hypothetical protein PHI73_01220 [Patescibacteria group bacterium]|nr:hypothetical protein [Patescibacteria group bacterium]
MEGRREWLDEVIASGEQLNAFTKFSRSIELRLKDGQTHLQFGGEKPI